MTASTMTEKLELFRTNAAGEKEVSGADIRSARKRLGLSIAKAAQNMDVGYQTLWRWENDKAQPLSDKIPDLLELIQRANRKR